MQKKDYKVLNDRKDLNVYDVDWVLCLERFNFDTLNVLALACL